MNAFGRYEIVRRIGVGGMGEVFFAWAYGVARTRKPVVVKVLRSEMLSEPGAPEMFVEEGRLSLHLSHMNILQVFDFGKADDRYFMAMEFVDGMHLGELRKKAGGRLNHDLAAFICMEVCLALDYAHRLKDESGRPLQIVHRDVTPSNVLISREGEVKLADFGIARAVGRSQHTQAGQIRGKVRYMSPEAARGEPLDHRSDLFSLGAVLFELLTGRRAFDAKGGREAILKQIVSGRAPAPSTAGDIHPALDAVVFKAMSPRREDRYTDAFAMHRGIEEACRDAGLRPSRGVFLEFLRALESAAATAEANSWSDPVDPAPAFPPVLMATPSAGRASNARSEGTVGVAPPPISRSGVMPARESAMQAPTVAPSASGSRAPKPSSSAGAVPPEIEGPQSTILPTGVQSPVLFTLVMGERENTPDLQDLPVFDVTREGMSVNLDFLPKVAPIPEEPEPPSRQRSDRIAPVIAADLPSGEKTIPPLRAMPPITVSVEPSHPSADVRPSERTTDRRSDPEDERVTVDPEPGPQMERITGSSAETAVRSSPVPLGYREPAPPPDDVAERRPDEDRWTVRRQEVPFTSPLLSPPPTSSRPSRPGRARMSPGVYAGGLVVVFVFAILLVQVAKRGENAAPTATPVARATRRPPEPTATVDPPTPIAVVTAAAATPLAVTPTPRPRVTDTPAPVETRIAAVSTPRPRPTATPRTVATAAPSAEPGVLILNTQPWTEFTIAGRALHTPVNGEKIPPGRYTVTLHSKYNPKLDRTIEIDVRSGATTRILLDLTHP